MDDVPVICPACGRNEVEETAVEGLCSECVIERIREAYGIKQRAAVLQRRAAWSERSQRAWDRDRQRVSRMERAVKPKQPAGSSDPYELAYEGLRELRKIEQLIRAHSARPEQYARLDKIAETLRRLAWGPDVPELVAVVDLPANDGMG